MFDIHTHILPGLDDGPQTIEEAVRMCRMAGETGTSDLTATPHFNSQFTFEPEAVRERLQKLRAAVGPRPVIHAGCELHITVDSVEAALANPTRYTINSGAFLLIEFSSFLVPKVTAHILRMLLAAGMVPIIAHPERNPLFQLTTDAFSEFCEMGCLVQITGQSFLGEFGKSAQQTAHKLLLAGMVHVVASDSHDSVHRPPRLDTVRRVLESTYDPLTAEILLEVNPRAVVAGLPGEIRSFKPTPKSILKRLRSALGGSPPDKPRPD